jgi:predicted dienelactone hydrolase
MRAHRSTSGARRRRYAASFGALVVTIAVVTGACSSSSDGGDSTSSTRASTTTSVADPAPYAKAGPFAVGFTRLLLSDGRRVVVWYPATRDAVSGHARETIDIASFLSPELQAKIPAGKRPLYRAPAYEDAPAATDAAPAPLVVFSHGFAGYPEQSVTLTTHLASWGFVVAAPDHVERSLDGLLGTAANGVAKRDDVAVLQSTLDATVAASKGSGVLRGMVDGSRVVAAGHSAGAGAAYAFASKDARVKAWISYSVGFGGRAGTAPAPPDKPGMVMLGTTDGIIPAAASRQVYRSMRSPKYLVEIGGAGHLVFSDICLIGAKSGGVTGIARAIGLPIPESLLKLGSDGCEKTHPPVAQAFPAIDQLSVAFFRSALGIDAKPVGLDTAAVRGLGATVTVQHRG